LLCHAVPRAGRWVPRVMPKANEPRSPDAMSGSQMHARRLEGEGVRLVPSCCAES